MRDRYGWLSVVLSAVLAAQSLALERAEFGKKQALAVTPDAGVGEAFDGLVGPAALGITRLAIDLGRGETASGR